MLFTDSISEANNTQVYNGKDIDVVMAIYNLREFSDIYLRESESLWQHHINEPALNNASTITDFPADNNNSI